MSMGSRGAMSTAATSGLKAAVERPWKEADQSMPCSGSPGLVVRDAAKAEGAALVLAVVGMEAVREVSISSTVGPLTMAAWGSMLFGDKGDFLLTPVMFS